MKSLLSAIPPFALQQEKGYTFWVKVTPKAAKNRVNGLIQDQFNRQLLKVYVTAPPQDNLANKAVIETLAEYLHYPKSSIKILSGLTTREKQIFVFN